MAQYLGLISLVVRDYDEAIAFYVQKLGFTLMADTYQPAQDRRWVVVAPLEQRSLDYCWRVPLATTNAPGLVTKRVVESSSPVHGRLSEGLQLIQRSRRHVCPRAQGRGVRDRRSVSRPARQSVGPASTQRHRLPQVMPNPSIERSANGNQPSPRGAIGCLSPRGLSAFPSSA